MEGCCGRCIADGPACLLLCCGGIFEDGGRLAESFDCWCCVDDDPGIVDVG